MGTLGFRSLCLGHVASSSTCSVSLCKNQLQCGILGGFVIWAGLGPKAWLSSLSFSGYRQLPISRQALQNTGWKGSLWFWGAPWYRLHWKLMPAPIPSWPGVKTTLLSWSQEKSQGCGLRMALCGFCLPCWRTLVLTSALSGRPWNGAGVVQLLAEGAGVWFFH
jgi:hypothetical protein